MKHKRCLRSLGIPIVESRTKVSSPNPSRKPYSWDRSGRTHDMQQPLIKKMAEVFPAPEAQGGGPGGRTSPCPRSRYQQWLHWWRGQGRKEQRRKLAERVITSGGFILAQVTHSSFHMYFLAMLGKGKIDTLISPAHFPGPSGAEAEMTYHCEQGEDVTVFTNSCGRKIIILKVCGLYRPYLLSQTTMKLISDTKCLILNNQ